MKTALSVFQKHEFGQVRTTTIDGEPWFALIDVCGILDISNPRNVTARLDEDEKGVYIMDTLGGQQELTVISEPGLYHVILTSRSEKAKLFKRWVTHEVLPAIRKEGFYSILETDKLLEMLIEKEAKQPDRIKNTLRPTLQAEMLKAQKTVKETRREKIIADCCELWKEIDQYAADYYTQSDFILKLRKLCRGDEPIRNKLEAQAKRDFKHISKGEPVSVPFSEGED